jgi:hypothetical protein
VTATVADATTIPPFVDVAASVRRGQEIINDPRTPFLPAPASAGRPVVTVAHCAPDGVLRVSRL